MCHVRKYVAELGVNVLCGVVKDCKVSQEALFPEHLANLEQRLLCWLAGSEDLVEEKPILAESKIAEVISYECKDVSFAEI